MPVIASPTASRAMREMATQTRSAVEPLRRFNLQQPLARKQQLINAILTFFQRQAEKRAQREAEEAGGGPLGAGLGGVGGGILGALVGGPAGAAIGAGMGAGAGEKVGAAVSPPGSAGTARGPAIASAIQSVAPFAGAIGGGLGAMRAPQAVTSPPAGEAGPPGMLMETGRGAFGRGFRGTMTDLLPYQAAGGGWRGLYEMQYGMATVPSQKRGITEGPTAAGAMINPFARAIGVGRGFGETMGGMSEQDLLRLLMFMGYGG